jgi:hypothetical protein
MELLVQELVYAIMAEFEDMINGYHSEFGRGPLHVFKQEVRRDLENCIIRKLAEYLEQRIKS